MSSRPISRLSFALRATFLPALAAFSSSACTGTDPAGGGVFEVRDSADIEVVETGRPTAEWRLSSEPEVRIGLVQGEHPYLLSGVRFAGRLEDGRIVVANGDDVEIRFFEADGRHRATVGREGQGPGEFVAFGDVRMGRGDTIWVRDARSPRITVVSPDEEIVREHPVLRLDDGTGLRLVAPVGSGRILVTTRVTDLLPPDLDADPVYERDTLALSVVDPASLEMRRVATLPGAERIMAVSGSFSEGTFDLFMGSPAFSYDDVSAVLGEHIVYGSTERAELRIVDDAGRPTRIIRIRGREPVPASQLRERHLEWVEERARNDEEENPAEQRRAEEERLALLPEGRVVPVFDDLMTDAAERIWLREYRLPWEADRPRAWSVYGSNGQPLGRIEVPDEVNVMHLGRDHLTGVVRDELDVEYVVVYRIETAS